MSETLLEIDGLQSGYGDVQVLWDISLMVREGELACIVGSNGAGKTTLLRTISGLIAPRAGSIRFAGREVVNPRTPPPCPAVSSRCVPSHAASCRSPGC